MGRTGTNARRWMSLLLVFLLTFTLLPAEALLAAEGEQTTIDSAEGAEVSDALPESDEQEATPDTVPEDEFVSVENNLESPEEETPVEEPVTVQDVISSSHEETEEEPHEEEPSVMLYPAATTYTITYDTVDVSKGYFNEWDEEADDYVKVQKRTETVEAGDYTWLPGCNDTLYETGYEFVGWYSDKACTKFVGGYDDYYEPTKSITLYAKYSKERYVVTVDANGGYFDGLFEANEVVAEDKSNYSITIYPGSRIYSEDLHEPLTENKQAFVGWAKDKEGKNIIDIWEDNSLGYYPEEDSTIYAIWEDAWTITLDANGGYLENFKGEAATKRTVNLPKGYEMNYVTRYETGYVWLRNDDPRKSSCGWSTSKKKEDIVDWDYIPQNDMTLYAIWEDDYLITYDANGGSFWNDETTRTVNIPEGNSLSYSYYDSYNVVHPDSTKILYGWAEDKSGKNAVAIDDLWRVTPTQDRTYYAVWRDKVTVTFDANGGSFDYENETPSQTRNLVSGEKIGWNYNTPYREKHLFDYWSTDKAGKNRVDSVYDYVVNSNVTLYAQWKACYTLTLDANGGCFSYEDPSEKSRTLELGPNEPIDYSPSTPYRNKYVFDYWSTDKAGKNKIDSISEYSITKNTTIYAQWKACYTLTLDANGGYFYDDPSEKTRTLELGANEQIDYSPTTPDRDKYVFDYWSTDKAGKNKIESISEYSISKDTTIYAQWAECYIVSLDANGGNYWGDASDTKKTAKVKKGNGYWIPYDNYELRHPDENLMWAGWAEDKAGTKVLEDGYAFPTKDVTYYAVWAQKLTITFDANGGYFDGDETKKTYQIERAAGKPINYTPSDPERHKYAFAYWSTDKEGKNKVDVYRYVADKNTTFYAQWADAYTVTLDGNGASVYVRNKGYNATQIINVEKGRSLRGFYVDIDDHPEGKAFVGWSENKNGTDVHTDLNYYEPTKDVTLYAIFADYVTVTFDGNGGTLDWANENDSTVSYEFKKGYTISYTPDVQDIHPPKGKKFTGWYLDKKATKPIKKPYLYVLSKDLTVYAGYENTTDSDKKVYTVTFDAGEGKNEVNDERFYTVQVEEGDELWQNYYAYKNEAGFIGWYTEASFKNKVSNYGYGFEPSGDCTLYARYGKEIQFTFDANGGKFSSGATVRTDYMTEGVSVYSSSSKPSRDNMLFAGWATDKAGKNMVADDAVFPGKAQTYYAIWETPWIVTLDANGGRYDDQNTTKTTALVRKGNTLNWVETPTAPAGKVFKGWATDKNGNSMINDTYSYAPTANTTIYAIWSSETWKVTYEANGGYFWVDGKETSQRVRYVKKGNTATYYYPSHDEENMYLEGWYLDKNLTQKVYPSDYYPQKDTTFYAKWEKRIVVTLRSNGGFFTNGSVVRYETMNPNGRMEFSRDSYRNSEKENATIKGWAKDAAGKTMLIDFTKVESEYFTFTENTTLYAIYTDIRTLTINSNNAGNYDPSIQTEEYAKGTVINLKEDVRTPYKDGQVFDGWYLDSSFKTKAGATITLNSNTTIYAKWKAFDGYTVTFDANGGYFWSDRMETTYQVEKGKILGYAPYVSHDNEKQTFVGWSESKDGKTIISNIQAYVPSKNATLYAIWTTTSCTVTFDPNGGYLDGEYQVVEKLTLNCVKGKAIGSYVSAYSNQPGKAFLGWSPYKSGAIVSRSGGDYVPTENITLYAQWGEGYIVTFHTAKGYFYGSNAQSLVRNVAKGDSCYTPYVSEAYTELIGYSEKADGSGIFYPYSSNFTPTKNMTLYAVFGDENSYIVTFDANGGRFPDDCSITTRKYSGNKELNYYWIDTPSKDGKVFQAWATDKSGKNKVSSDYVISKSQTLYAVYADPVTITLNYNGGTSIRGEVLENYSFEVASGTMISETDILDLASRVEKNGKVSIGVASTASATTALAGTTKLTKTQTLYVIYSDAWTVTLDKQQGEWLQISANNYLYDAVYGNMDTKGLARIKVQKGKALSTAPALHGRGQQALVEIYGYIKSTDANKAFAGWYTKADGKGTLVDLSTYKPTANVTLYAYYVTPSPHIEPTSATITVGEKKTLEVYYPYAAASKAKVTWSTADKSIATVSGGVVTGVKEGKTTIIATVDGKKLTSQITVKKANPSVEYQAKVIGDSAWQGLVRDGAQAGTTGQSLIMEAYKIHLIEKSSGTELDPSILGVKYRGHIQSYGWEKEVKDFGVAGRENEGKRIEALELSLTGSKASEYDIYYCLHVQSYGWLNWAKNGERAGTASMSKRVEAIRIQLVPKGGAAPKKLGTRDEAFLQGVYAKYSAKVIGQKNWLAQVKDGAIAGTTGKSLIMEAFKLDADQGVKVYYKGHIQSYGWEKDWKTNNQVSGREGEGKRIEAIQMKLDDASAKKYDIYYCMHVQSFGWLNWANNGESAGSANLSRRVEAIAVQILPKGSKAPGKLGSRADSFIQGISAKSATLNKNSTTVGVGKTVQLSATVTPSNVTMTKHVWNSSNTSVATVDANGKVTGKKKGTATITFTTQDGYKKATCKITVE